jgi:uroporphyrinogen III methyltransferase / synthase
MNPLTGRTIFITRSRHQAAELREILEAAGARVVEIPTIEIQPRSDFDWVLGKFREYDWVFFTSANGVRIFLDRAQAVSGLQQPVLPQICAIGPATAGSIEQYGYQVDLLPSLFQAEGILEDFLARHRGKVEGLRVLLPRAARAREVLPETLSSRGVEVTVVPVYDTILPQGGRERIRQAFAENQPDLITLTSSSTVENFVSLAGDLIDVRDFRYAAIGPITAQTAAEHGLPVVVQPDQFTVPALVAALESYFQTQAGWLEPPRR